MRRPACPHPSARPFVRLTAPVATLACVLLLPAADLSAQNGNRMPVRVAVDTMFHGLRARPIGPPGTSGRVAAIAVSPRDEREIWVGAATGGLWKSRDAGFTWTPTTDTIPVNSIGAIGIAPSAPDIVYVATGEANTRNSMGVGRGVWKTLDGGRSWRYLGLPATERFESVVVHPDDPNTVWLSAQGPAWSDGEERGVFKSTDGGTTWRKVLYVDARPARSISSSIHPTPSTCSFRRGSTGAGRGSSSRAALAAGYGAAGTVAKAGVGSRRRKACRRVSSAASVWRSRTTTRAWSMHSSKPGRARCYGATTAARRGVR